MTPFQERVQEYCAHLETVLDRWLPAADKPPQRLHQAMRYAVLGGGKRMRPLLVYATGEVLGVAREQLDGPAAAVEIIHAYSLIHDDLPAMDDDDLRRGRPTCHKAFDEATAILAGDALQVLAFQILAEDARMTVSPAARVKMLHSLAVASGAAGMAGGQAMDMDAIGKSLSLAELELMHIHKTGALIRVSVLLAAQCAPGLIAEKQTALDRYAKCVGLAFQIHDDILDVEGETAALGKQAGADASLNKPTYPSVLGLAESRERAQSLHHSALEALKPFGAVAQPLAWLSEYIVTRKH
ncbi:MAG: (2E,6E)-farnesyl diphosphate synthase [Gammaproteobacteria bacterium]|nr:(2E,6E)-farnesyl diphosphate synthase [Gammaproteobacteria bacterium]MDE1886872.1 (2E,6E)-farnesyl diphosphate synthase [Gammaproteobacteria bacterium]MDE2022658.1 (2E,6E)-farnesyl diphosphate synthase [Gammaproteobacteria bacterium]MDE2138952.1 (2E,6E)-farnesyl diphosphate synthase [Gammaproteobacteria bacterium]MDE2273176.1 (2E,6E)-farnesyl diphosphate synthase [Gammaproteobacteria bacterium]